MLNSRTEQSTEGKENAKAAKFPSTQWTSKPKKFGEEAKMNKLFLILLPAKLDRESVIKYLEANKSINFWFHSFPSSFFARSSFSANQLQRIILNKYPTDLIFIIQVNSTTDLSGLVPDNQVHLFNNR